MEHPTEEQQEHLERAPVEVQLDHLCLMEVLSGLQEPMMSLVARVTEGHETVGHEKVDHAQVDRVKTEEDHEKAGPEMADHVKTEEGRLDERVDHEKVGHEMVDRVKMEEDRLGENVGHEKAVLAEQLEQVDPGTAVRAEVLHETMEEAYRSYY